jgi:hypothetical protein
MNKPGSEDAERDRIEMTPRKVVTASAPVRLYAAPRKSWCESNDRGVVAKAADVVGLYVDPPAKVFKARRTPL